MIHLGGFARVSGSVQICPPEDEWGRGNHVQYSTVWYSSKCSIQIVILFANAPGSLFIGPSNDRLVCHSGRIRISLMNLVCPDDCIACGRRDWLGVYTGSILKIGLAGYGSDIPPTCTRTRRLEFSAFKCESKRWRTVCQWEPCWRKTRLNLCFVEHPRTRTPSYNVEHPRLQSATKCDSHSIIKHEGQQGVSLESQ